MKQAVTLLEAVGCLDHLEKHDDEQSVVGDVLDVLGDVLSPDP